MKNKPGFHASLVVVILCVVVLAGAIGFIFWNTYNSKKSDKAPVNTQATSDSTKKNSDKTSQNQDTYENDISCKNTQSTNSSWSFMQTISPGLKNYSVDNSKLCYNFGFKYPENWVITDVYTTEPGHWVEITATSPTKKTKVFYNVGYTGGKGGICDPEFSYPEMGELEQFTKDSNVNLNRDGNQVNLVELLFSKNNIVTEARTYLTDSNNQTKDYDYCQTYLTEFIDLKPEVLDGNGLWSAINDTKIILSDIQNTDGSIKPNITSQNVTDARSTEEYKQAKSILMSTTYSKI